MTIEGTDCSLERWAHALDNCLVSEGVAVASRRFGPDIGSDHLPLIVDFALASGGA